MLWSGFGSAASAEEVIDLYILAGQSNMVGYGQTNQVSPNELQVQTDVLFFNNLNVWTNYAPRPDTLSDTGFGPEITIGRTIAVATGRRAAMVKFAVGATDLFRNWNPHIAGSLYHQMLDRVAAASQALRAQGKIVYVGGFFWMQGESDATADLQRPLIYEPNLRDLVRQLRLDLDHPQLPFIIGRISDSSAWPNRAFVRDAQANVGQKVANCRSFSTDDLVLLADNAHYNSASILILGQRFAEAWLSIPDANSPTNPPKVLRAYGGPGRTNIHLSFSKPLIGASTNVANFSVSGELAISNAILNTNNNRSIELLSGSQAAGSNYAVSVAGVYDFSGNTVSTNSLAAFFAHPESGAVFHVAEAADYQLVYALDIPVANPNWHHNSVAYTVDGSSSVHFPFSRIAYYLELLPYDEPLQYLFVSMNAFTNNPATIGVPALSSAGSFQRYLTNLTIYSNVQGIQSGVGLGLGNLEFWPSNYTTANSLGISGASSDIYDWGDQAVDPADGYGSMQIHRPAAGQVLFAYNRWGEGEGNSDLGIGNNFGVTNYAYTNRGFDFTFMSNASEYSLRRMEILILPPPRLHGTVDSSQVILRWSTTYTGFSLQNASNLASPVWLTVTNNSTPTNRWNQVILQRDRNASFFRLAK